jgi:tetraprenyl-beta-curcumene synthase
MGTSVLSRRIDRRVRVRSAASAPAVGSAMAAAVAVPDVAVDPAPWSSAQGRALARAVTRECGWGLRLVHHEVTTWQARAARIPHAVARANALEALSRKRSYLDGAALFWTLPERRDPRLLSLLVRFQITADFLDQASEHGVAARGRSGGRLMPAFVDAIDLGAPPAGSYYADHPWGGDDGYLDDLVDACRTGCAGLPGYAAARELLVREARRARALELVHEPDAASRDAQLRGLRGERPPDEVDPAADPWWFEMAAGSASALTVIVLLALAADPATTDEDRHAAARAYRWVGALSTVLDGYVDQLEDAESGGWSSVAHYADATVATERIGALIDRTLREVGALKDGERHLVVVSAMIALFLSRNSARSGELAPSTRELIASGGTLTRRLVPVLRLWRTAFGQRAA